MKARLNKLQELKKQWGELQVEKETKVHELWTIETKINTIEEKLKKYGQEHILEMADETAVVD